MNANLKQQLTRYKGHILTEEAFFNVKSAVKAVKFRIGI
jgi:hypothetical protein